MADFLAPSVNFIGKGTIAEIGPRVTMFGKKALIVTDRTMSKLPPLAIVKDELSRHGVDFIVFDDVDPNPRISNA